MAMSFLQTASERLSSIAAVALFATSVAPLIAHAQYVQQGPKRVGTDHTIPSNQGGAAISGDGNTVVSAGAGDDGFTGGFWTWTRSNGVWSQQGNKILGSGATGKVGQGSSIAISADGQTVIMGSASDDSNTGAAWVFERNGISWKQQGPKLAGPEKASSVFGASVALSADGNTALIGGPLDNNNVGAAWIWTRSGGVWTRGAKLVGTGAVGDSYQGFSVALSADGSTALISGMIDNPDTGVAWVFVRSGNIWLQQGGRLLCNDLDASIQQSFRAAALVSLSADGNTAAIGGSVDHGGDGAAWIFTHSNGVWTQQGSKLVGQGAVGKAYQAHVALSADGLTLSVVGLRDNSGIGAAWIFSRSGNTWIQAGSKLVGRGTVGQSFQASSALSADGTTLVLGGGGDDNGVGAIWLFAKLPAIVKNSPHDFDADSRSDIVWRQAGGGIGLWLMNGASIVGSAGYAGVPSNYQIVAQRDFNGDGYADFLFSDGNGSVAMWFMKGLKVVGSAGLSYVPSGFFIAGSGDYDGDGKGDLLWADGNGNVAIWLMNGSVPTATAVYNSGSSSWRIFGTGDFNGDGRSDILWRDSVGNIAIWLMDGLTRKSGTLLGAISTAWTIVGTGDFDGDGKSDILFRDTSGNIAIWLMDGASVKSSTVLGTLPLSFFVAVTGDYDGDGRSDIIWRDATSGATAIWTMNGATVAAAIVPNPGLDWTIQGMNAD